MKNALALVLAMALVGCSEAPTAPQAAVPPLSASSINAGNTASVWIPVDMVYGDPSGCLGEQVHLTGYQHFRGHRTTLPNGDIREQYTFGYKVDAIGLTSGERYHYQNVYPQNYGWLVGDGEGDHRTFTYMFQIRGNGHIVKEHVTYLWTWNGNGDPVVDKVNSLWECE